MIVFCFQICTAENLWRQYCKFIQFLTTYQGVPIMRNILSFKTNGGESVKGTAAEGETILLIDSISTARGRFHSLPKSTKK